jgi:hypothetical protein
MFMEYTKPYSIMIHGTCLTITIYFFHTKKAICTTSSFVHYVQHIIPKASFLRQNGYRMNHFQCCLPLLLIHLQFGNNIDISYNIHLKLTNVPSIRCVGRQNEYAYQCVDYNSVDSLRLYMDALCCKSNS